MTPPRDDRGSAGRGNPAGPFSLYARLMGRPPGHDQIPRLTKIGRVLEAGPEDTAWGLIVAQEAYLVWMRDSVLHVTAAIRAWSVGILAMVLLVGFSVGSLVWSVRSADIEPTVARQMDRAIDRLSAKLAPPPDCGAGYEQSYCDALRIVNANANKREIVGAVAAVSDETASTLASSANLAEVLTWMTRLNSSQWEQIMKMSTAKTPSQKGREAR